MRQDVPAGQHRACAQQGPLPPPLLPAQVSRFRRELEAASGERDSLAAELAAKQQLLAAAEAQLAAIDAHSRRRLAALRWRNAGALVGTHCPESTVQTGGYEGAHSSSAWLLPAWMWLRACTGKLRLPAC
jgi:hypothetical protein